ncbi:hypothetical protein CHARACLAT_022926 [Characodon lateralis]|uniref:Uncharacterized protein n=1 Tax=Characodon lateralis TaxID=208331 RepID=A0ABU7CQL7_9TELE|nr:hypothetical protein [Characodon lateralis]
MSSYAFIASLPQLHSNHPTWQQLPGVSWNTAMSYWDSCAKTILPLELWISAAPPELPWASWLLLCTILFRFR